MTDAQIRRNVARNEPIVRPKFALRASTATDLKAAAHASGLSLGLYLELLTQHLSHQEGGLPILAPQLDGMGVADQTAA